MDGGATLGRGQTFPLENYKKGARVWHRDAELVWISGELEHDVTFSTKEIRILLENEQSVVIPIKTVDQLPFLRNPDILIGSDDLTALSYLHEPAVLYNVQYRFVEREAIYTYCGIVLVAINPYMDCSHLYADEVIQVYRGVGKQVRELDPHIYAVAEEAFFDLSEYGKNQSVIVSGESGAGKTVSAKFVMRYFASVAGSRNGQKGIENRVLASNPIMEAIGNAKTIRNDNSSRFGKYIQLNFGDRFAISGAEMKTYLLEKSRLVFQAQNERNYHIFYQMCASAGHPLLKQYRLGPANDYHYTGQGRACSITGVDDGKEFADTVKALSEVGFDATLQQNLMRVLAGVLLLGNVDFDKADEKTSIKSSSKSCVSQLCSELFEINESSLREWLTNREIRAVTEVVRKPLDNIEAQRNRDALAKMIYASVFGWVVERVNGALRGGEKTKGKERFIGVLDIYGFETFEVNSFEQFCINYANEKLQQQFNQHVFKLEQNEYEREEIAWVRIDFYDNQPCIDLIEARPGLIDYLDEQCKVVRGSDAGWLTQITNCATLKKKEQLQLPKIRSASFMIKHFAADVSYTVDGFMEKNKDTVSENLLDVVANTKFDLLRELVLGAMPSDKMASLGRKTSKKTVASQFRDSLKELMTVLGATRPHYVRCIKPNDSKERFSFEPKRAIQQLRACGVLETVRISAAGYPSRWAYDDFGKRYRVLYPEGRAQWRDASKKFAQNACAKHLEEGKFALGKTKIFFRTGQVALLERKRQETLGISATRIQTIFRGYLARKKYQKMKESIRIIQAATRAYFVFRRIKFIQMHRAAVCIQTAWRRHREEQKYNKLRRTVLTLQAHFRGARARREFMKAKFEKSAVTIQRYWRGYRVRRADIERKRKIIKTQACVRRWLAKRELKRLKIEARSVGHLQKLNSGLENKIIVLQLKLDASTAEVHRLNGVEMQLTASKAESDKKETKIRELSMLGGRVEELEAEVERLETECDLKEAQRTEIETRIQQLTSTHEMHNSEMEKRLAEAMEREAALSKERDALDARRMELEKMLITESDRRHLAEQEMTAMREQLLQNANLLASPAFSRVGSVRDPHRGGMALPPGSSFAVAGPDGGMVTVGGSGDIDEIALILRQQQIINELRMRAEQNQRENDRLKGIMDANSLIESLDRRTSIRTFEAQRLQELELAYTKMKLEVERLVAEKADNGFENMNIKLFIDKIIEENDRRREESTELRAMLTNRFERQSGNNPSSSPRPDSGHWSATHSDDGTADLDEELCLERQCRQLKAHIETLTRTVTERNIEIEKLEKRLTESVPQVVCEGNVDRNRAPQTRQQHHDGAYHQMIAWGGARTPDCHEMEPSTSWYLTPSPEKTTHVVSVECVLEYTVEVEKEEDGRPMEYACIPPFGRIIVAQFLLALVGL